MNKSSLLKILAATSAIVFFVFLISRAQAVDSDQHNRYNAAIRELKETDALLNQDVLRSRYGLLGSYDQIEVELAQVKRLQTVLRDTPSYIDSDGQAEINNGLEELRRSFDSKESLIQKFKSQNAVINNSLDYFPIAMKQLINRAALEPGGGQLDIKLNSLLQDVLLYSQAPNDELAEKITRQIVKLSQVAASRHQSSLDSELRITLNHAETILNRKPEVENLTKTLVAIPFAGDTEKLYTTYTLYYESALRSARSYWFGLYAISTALLCLIILKLKRTSQGLDVANKKLEEKILESTLTNVKLQSNIVERKQMELELQQARDAALESARLKSEFLANMSHEIRTPINGVIGMTGLLLDTELTGDQREFAEMIQFSGDTLLTIINDILDFSKIEAGKLRFEMLDFDLSHTIEDTVELLAERAQGKKIELASLIYNDVPTALRGDPGRLRQVLINLISNALKFTDHGEVIVRVEQERETDQEVVLRFTVSDTGIGISEAAQRNLFQAFTQADGSTTRKYGGTGLGLAISKQLVEIMNGQIGVNSVPLQGSTFWFTARFDRQPLAQTSTRPGAPNLNRLRALIVDDNAAVRRVLSHQLSAYGIIPEEADSGARALDLLRSAKAQDRAYDLALLDLKMPEMDGFELARTISSDPQIADVRLGLLTSFAQRDPSLMAQEVGIAAYLSKPVRQSQLFDCLTTMISQPPAPGEPDISRSPAPLLPLTEQPLQKAQAMPQRLILVVEDNPVNQKVAARLLSKLNYRADVVADGREAIEALERIAYDLVMMDCQMPVMDGYEATAEIRRREGETKHTPIIALTAHALASDGAKCLAAGMDGYLSKPVKLQELATVLEQWLTGSSKNVENGGTDTQQDMPPVDMAQLGLWLGDEQAEIFAALRMYEDYMATGLEKLEAAIGTGNADELTLLAHDYKDISLTCGITAVIEPLNMLEHMGRENQLAGAEGVNAQLGREFARVRSFLQKRQEPAPQVLYK